MEILSFDLSIKNKVYEKANDYRCKHEKSY